MALQGLAVDQAIQRYLHFVGLEKGKNMIELPEAITIARQMNAAIQGKQIEDCVRGNTPHKFAFYTRDPEDYSNILSGKVVGRADHHGALIRLFVEDDCLLVLGYGGERIIFHASAAGIPAKHHLLLLFKDGTAMSVTVQGWGFCHLILTSEIPAHPYLNRPGPDPLDPAFTPEYFASLFAAPEVGSARSLKSFLTSEPGMLGLGNGCMQDILFNARLDPRRKVNSLTESEKDTLYVAMRTTLDEMTRLGGRSSEHDLFDNLGGYERLLDANSVAKPCPRCATPI